MEYREHMVPRGRYRIYTKDYPGEKPAIVLMHGFPDNLHLYDRLVPRLSSRRVVVFDFLDWGRSTSVELPEEKHIMAVPLGENGWLVELERFYPTSAEASHTTR